MYLTNENIDKSIAYYEREILEMKNEISEREKVLSFKEGCLQVWKEIKREAKRVQAEAGIKE